MAAPVTVFSAGVTQGSNPDVITLGADGNLWFTASDRVDRFNPTTGHVDEFTAGITPNTVGHSVAGGITTGPDGNVWFSEPNRPGIARITPSGTVTELPALPTGSHPTAMTTGPDGNVWFVDDSDMVGRINPTTLHIDEFPLSAGAGPESIATGPDGNLWITESGDEANTHIARITPSGQVTEFQPSLGLPSLGLITSGIDGNLWFTEPSNNAMARSTTSGAITTFSSGLSPNVDLAGETEGPEAITTGIDGNVWFTEGDHGPAVGRIAPNGTITEFPHGLNLAITIPSDGLTTGPDGNLWFPVDSIASGGVDGIARFTLPPVNTALPVISGTPAEGTVLSTTNGAWKPNPISFSYQWRRCDASGNNCANVGTNVGSYTLTVMDIGHTVRVIVTATNAAGSTPATSAYTASVVDTPPQLSGVRLAPTSFRAKKGTTLSLTLSKPATVKIVITQSGRGRKVKGRCKANVKKGKRCTLTRKRGTRTFNGAQGADRFRLLLKRLKPGRYKLTVTAVDAAGQAAKPVTRAFTIKAPRKKH